MAKNDSSDKLTDLINVCYSHFIYEETQSEIAEKMGVSRAKVCKMIAQAKSMGLYTITINDPVKKAETLSRQLQEKYNLRGIRIVPIPKFGIKNLLQRIGITAAELLSTLVRDNDIIGIAGGTTLYEMIHNLDTINVANSFIVPLLGGYPETETATGGAEIAYRMAEKLGSSIITMPVPGLAQSAKEAQVFLSNPIVQRSMNWMQKCSIALFGIGTPSALSSYYNAGVLTDELVGELRGENAVGCVCFNFYDAAGNSCEKFNSRIIGASLDDIKHIPITIGVAGGAPEKVPAIRGALLGNYLDFLVTDQITAAALVE